MQRATNGRSRSEISGETLLKGCANKTPLRAERNFVEIHQRLGRARQLLSLLVAEVTGRRP